MGYEISINKALDELKELAEFSRYSVQLLADNYEVRIDERAVLTLAANAPAGEVEAVLILHYLIGLQKCGFHPTGEWISFKEIEGGKVFWPAFEKSTIKPLLECFQKDPENLAAILVERFRGKMVEGGNTAVEVATFPEIFVRIIFWMGDEELPGGATILFDRGLMEVYSTEDVAVLLLFLVQKAIRYETARKSRHTFQEE
jgi:hypothetical protein